MKKLLLGLLVLGLTAQGFAQIVTESLTEIEIKGINYLYINKMNNESEIAIPVKKLHKEVANYDIFNEEFYHEDFEVYQVSFNIPKGFVLAVYDDEGLLLRTVEKFRDVRLPVVVAEAIVSSYPGWDIIGDIYYLTYDLMDGATKKYKVKLAKDGKKMSVNIDAGGDFI